MWSGLLGSAHSHVAVVCARDCLWTLWRSIGAMWWVSWEVALVALRRGVALVAFVVVAPGRVGNVGGWDVACVPGVVWMWSC